MDAEHQPGFVQMGQGVTRTQNAIDMDQQDTPVK